MFYGVSGKKHTVLPVTGLNWVFLCKQRTNNTLIQQCKVKCLQSKKDAYLFSPISFLAMRLHGGVVVSTGPSQQRVPGSIPTWGLSVWSLHVLPVNVWVLSGYSGFLPPTKNMHVRLTGDSEIVLRSEWVCVVVCLCVALWWTGGLFRVYPTSRPSDPTDGLRYWKWMDGRYCNAF